MAKPNYQYEKRQKDLAKKKKKEEKLARRAQKSEAPETGDGVGPQADQAGPAPTRQDS